VSQLWCNADNYVLLSRFRERALSGLRHSGHQYHLNQSEFAGLLKRKTFSPLDLAVELVDFNTNDFGSEHCQNTYMAFLDQNS